MPVNIEIVDTPAVKTYIGIKFTYDVGTPIKTYFRAYGDPDEWVCARIVEVCAEDQGHCEMYGGACALGSVGLGYMLITSVRGYGYVEVMFQKPGEKTIEVAGEKFTINVTEQYVPLELRRIWVFPQTAYEGIYRKIRQG